MPNWATDPANAKLLRLYVPGEGWKAYADKLAKSATKSKPPAHSLWRFYISLCRSAKRNAARAPAGLMSDRRPRLRSRAKRAAPEAPKNSVGIFAGMNIFYRHQVC